ncbi:hypothetical protein BJX62DRAFT_250989 [Aspergillus germanicus]
MATWKKPYVGLTGGWLTFWVSAACSIDMMLFGYDQGVFSGVVVTSDFLEVHNLVGPAKTKTLSTVTAIYDVGCFLGAILAFTLGEWLGRKNSILLGTTIMAVGTILQASSYSLAQMFVGRIILGVGNGVNTATAPVWQTETAQMKWRGKLVILELGLNVGGYCIVNWINYALSFQEGSIAWRLPIALQLVFICALFATVPWLPEPPRWLLAHGRREEGLEVLSCIEAKPVDDAYIVAQHDEIQYSVQYERDNAVRWRDLLLGMKSEGTKTLRRLLLGAGTQAIQQLQGINIMSYYHPLVLINSFGLSNALARLLTACNAISYFIFSCAITTVVEKLGRRGLMLLSGFGQFLSFLVITILLRFVLRITNFAIVEITPIGIQNLGWKFWIVWTVLNAVFLPVIYFLYSETADCTLEDVDAYYRTNPPLIVVGDPDAISTKRPLRFMQHEDEKIQRKAKEAQIETRKGYLTDVEYVE